jgi:hypothetical protein
MHEVCSFLNALRLSSGILKIPSKPIGIEILKKGFGNFMPPGLIYKPFFDMARLYGIRAGKFERNPPDPPCLGEALRRVIFVNIMIFLKIPSSLNFSRIFQISPK